MVISETNQACGFFQENEFKPFCSPACLLKDYHELRNKYTIGNDQIYFTDYDKKTFVQSDSTFFLMTKTLPTVMNSGVLTFDSEAVAQQLLQQSDETVISWMKYQVIGGTPDKTINAVLQNNKIDPDVFTFDKNQIIQLDIKNVDKIDDRLLRIKGYEKYGPFRFMKNEEVLRIRLMADKPGSGFPILLDGIEQPLGMIKVSGSHTQDEEVM